MRVQDILDDAREIDRLQRYAAKNEFTRFNVDGASDVIREAMQTIQQAAVHFKNQEVSELMPDLSRQRARLQGLQEDLYEMESIPVEDRDEWDTEYIETCREEIAKLEDEINNF